MRRCSNRARGVSSLDRQFDRLLPHELRHLSLTHWTPVQVAVRAASLLGATRYTRVLDVGSGVGKVCSIGALSTSGTWVGVEQHARLVDTASDLARALGVADRTRFLRADAFAIDWNEFDALYFYNPFELALFDDARPNPSKSVQIARVQQRLAALPNCTRVVTVHGFGGEMPPSFELLYHERMPEFALDVALWIQRTSRQVTSVAP
jgi:SAM-dependent methyltransferase